MNMINSKFRMVATSGKGSREMELRTYQKGLNGI